MDEPTITSLHYKLNHTKSVTFKAPPAVEDEWSGFRYQLADSEPTITLPVGDSNFPLAMQVVDPWVRSWEIAAGIGHPKAGIEFEFDYASTVPLDPENALRGEPYILPAISFSIHHNDFRHPCNPLASEGAAAVAKRGGAMFSPSRNSGWPLACASG